METQSYKWAVCAICFIALTACKDNTKKPADAPSADDKTPAAKVTSTPEAKPATKPAADKKPADDEPEEDEADEADEETDGE